MFPITFTFLQTVGALPGAVWFNGSDYVQTTHPGGERLRVHIGQFAREIADEAGLAHCIGERDDGLGFECVPDDREPGAQPQAPMSRGILTLLHTLSAPYNPNGRSSRIETIHLVRDIGPLLQGWPQENPTPASTPPRLSDVGLVKLFRLIRLSRRLLELETRASEGGGASSGS